MIEILQNKLKHIVPLVSTYVQPYKPGTPLDTYFDIVIKSDKVDSSEGIITIPISSNLDDLLRLEMRTKQEYWGQQLVDIMEANLDITDLEMEEFANLMLQRTIDCAYAISDELFFLCYEISSTLFPTLQISPEDDMSFTLPFYTCYMIFTTKEHSSLSRYEIEVFSEYGSADQQPIKVYVHPYAHNTLKVNSILVTEDQSELDSRYASTAVTSQNTFLRDLPFSWLDSVTYLIDYEGPLILQDRTLPTTDPDKHYTTEGYNLLLKLGVKRKKRSDTWADPRVTQPNLGLDTVSNVIIESKDTYGKEPEKLTYLNPDTLRDTYGVKITYSEPNDMMYKDDPALGKYPIMKAIRVGPKTLFPIYHTTAEDQVHGEGWIYPHYPKPVIINNYLPEAGFEYYLWPISSIGDKRNTPIGIEIMKQGESTYTPVYLGSPDGKITSIKVPSNIIKMRISRVGAQPAEYDLSDGYSIMDMNYGPRGDIKPELDLNVTDSVMFVSVSGPKKVGNGKTVNVTVKEGSKTLSNITAIFEVNYKLKPNDPDNWVAIRQFKPGVFSFDKLELFDFPIVSELETRLTTYPTDTDPNIKQGTLTIPTNITSKLIPGLTYNVVNI